MRVAILMDGGFTRVMGRAAGYQYNPDFIVALADCAVETPEVLHRVLYYDCAPYNGTLPLPVSGVEKEFNASGQWLDELARRNLFAVRRGVLKFRGFVPKKIPVSPRALSDGDFKPSFEQKGVDMRIGLDMAVLAANRSVDRIILISNDTDCVPAMKHVRKAGLQLVLGKLANQTPPHELVVHADIVREVAFPQPDEGSTD
ncbi:MAG: NYN domain-containing protein [Alphaproteobacteria bacterium]|nr:NYN domain-containing protein [Alphaproteobacteria bacterium]